MINIPGDGGSFSTQFIFWSARFFMVMTQTASSHLIVLFIINNSLFAVRCYLGLQFDGFLTCGLKAGGDN